MDVTVVYLQDYWLACVHAGMHICDFVLPATLRKSFQWFTWVHTHLYTTNSLSMFPGVSYSYDNKTRVQGAPV